MANHNPKQETNQSLDNAVNGREVTPEEIAYRNGYVRGREQEDRLYREELRLRQEQQRALSNSNTTAGVFLGIVLLILAGCVGGVIWAIARPDNALQQPITTPPSTTENDSMDTTQDAAPSEPTAPQPNITIDLPPADQSGTNNVGSPTEPDGNTLERPTTTDSESAPVDNSQSQPDSADTDTSSSQP